MSSSNGVSRHRCTRGRSDGESLREAEACTQLRQIGALLRREGLYFSNLRTWRDQLRRVGEVGLASTKRGPTPKLKNPLATKVVALEREVARQKARADRAEALVDLQKKVAAFLESERTRKSGKG